MRLHRLLSNLYVSAFPDERTLKRENFDVIVTMCKKRLDISCTRECKEYIYHPISDSSQIPGLVPDVSYAVDQVVKACSANRKVLVHCYMGRSRSWLVATLAYARITGCNRKQAWYTAKLIYPGAFKNPAFEEFMTK